MYIFAHIAAGLVIGCLAALLLHDRRWVIPCVIGSILPDLVDKPLGYLLSGYVFAFGRIYFHTLYLFLVLLLFGVIWWQWRKSPVVIALALGVLSHQLLDAMWQEPWNWLYPFFGPFQSSLHPDFILEGITGELANPSEWIAGITLVLLVILYLRRDRVLTVVRTHYRAAKTAVYIAVTALAAVGLFTVWQGFTRGRALVTGWQNLTDNVIAGLVILGTAWLLWIWWRRLAKRPETRAAGSG